MCLQVFVAVSLVSLCSCSPLLPGLDWAPSLLQQVVTGVNTGTVPIAIDGGPGIITPAIDPPLVTTVMNPPTLPPVLPLILVAAVIKAILLGKLLLSINLIESLTMIISR